MESPPNMLKLLRIVPWFIFLPVCAQRPDAASQAKATAHLHALLDAAPQQILSALDFTVHAPADGWELGMVSSIAVDRSGAIYVLQRGDKADPVIVLSPDGHVLRSWGKGLYKTPHSIRIDPQGDVWTVDAESSVVLKFTPEGKQLLKIEVGEQPTGRTSRFVGTTDIAFGPNGRLFISDGYRNARILEYTADGKRVHQWGTPGNGPGQFRLPHGISIDQDGVLYVADRENGRIQKFDMDGKYLGEWPLGRTYAVQVEGDEVWATMQAIDMPVPSPGWMVKLDRKTGKVLGSVASNGLHSIAVSKDGQLMAGDFKQPPNRFLLFR
jgi:DNA-binding beta-propeller fold protein YncE